MSEVDVMVLDDESMVCERLQDFLTKKGYVVETFTESTKALARLDEKEFAVVVTDMKMAGPTGLDVLMYVKKKELPTQVIVITGYASIETAREAEAIGAYDFINKPFKLADIYNLVRKAAKKFQKDKKRVAKS